MFFRVEVSKFPHRAIAVAVYSMAANAKAAKHPLAMFEQPWRNRNSFTDRFDITGSCRIIK